MQRKMFVVTVMITGLMLSLAPRAATVTAPLSPPAMLKHLFEVPPDEIPTYFTPEFLAQVPAAKLLPVFALYKSTLGSLRQVVGDNGSYEMIFEKGKAPAKITLDAQGKIAGLWFGVWTLFNDSPTRILDELKKLDGQVSLTLIRNGDRLIDLAGNRPMAVGSTFKLYILKTLRDRIAAGKCRWDQELRLEAALRSLPSGILQNWPVGTPMTLRTLANLMISISDNTATDHLLSFLGRQAVEAETPVSCRPFFSTLEAFKIKYGWNDKQKQAFREADLAGRRKMIAGLADEKRPEIGSLTTPDMIDTVEWFLSTRDLCTVMGIVGDDPGLSINPGLVDSSQWHHVSYKGGSEPGVLNYTLLLQKSASAPVFVLSATINNPRQDVNTRQFTELVVRLTGLLADGKLDTTAAPAGAGH